MIARRHVVKGAVAGGAGLFVPAGSAAAGIQPVAGRSTLDPRTIDKYVMPLVVPPVMPRAGQGSGALLDYYSIGARQFRQQILPPGMPATTVWGYGSTQHPETFHYPGHTIEARVGIAVRVRWVNELVDRNGHYLPPLLAVDPTLHWANPPGGTSGRDSRPEFTSTPGPYTGPVPFVTHLHGGLSSEESDGDPIAWYLPDARDIPRGYAREGSLYSEFREKFAGLFGVTWRPGEATYNYDNRQPAATLWYHDHSLGITRLSVYPGLAGFYLLRGGPEDLPEGVLPGPAPKLGDPPGRSYREIPILIQDKSFNVDGSLYFPSSRADFDGCTGPYIPGSDVPPIWNPETFGNTMVANGRTWPALEVEPRRYRFRFLNGCNARYLILKIVTNRLAPRPAPPALPIWQIGAEGSFLPTPARLHQLLIAPAERADVVVDFTSLPVGTELYLINEAPDQAFGGGTAGTDFAPADPTTTGQVMKFVVRPLTSPDTSTPPRGLTLPPIAPIGPARLTRRLSLNELGSDVLPGEPSRILKLGTVDPSGNPVPLGWGDPVTEHPAVETNEVWELHNFTPDAHPIHIHEVQFQVVNRDMPGQRPQPPQPWETGFKDTVVAYPHAVTRVRLRFERAGNYVWHCHMLDHEDNEMMRRYLIG